MTSLSSLAARMGGINFDDLQWEKRYNPTQAYSQSKSANLMFASANFVPAGQRTKNVV